MAFDFSGSKRPAVLVMVW